MRNFKHFTKYDRIRIEAWLRSGCSVNFIAGELDKSRSSVYREIKRGAYVHTLSDLTTEVRYSSDLSDSKYRDNLKAKGGQLKIGCDLAYAHYLEYLIHECRYSPEAALAYIKSHDMEFNTTISKTTLYRYIDIGMFLHLTNKDLYIKSKKCKYRHRKVHCCSAPKGKSIEQRPDEVMLRNSFGHWEMDCVVGRQTSKPVLLVLTERLTRKELIFKMPNKKAPSVVSVLNLIHSSLGDNFCKVFKTITCDNGVEFSDSYGITHGIDGSMRVALYYCHPYSSCERGSNENQNRLIRRFFPKGTSFSDVSKKQIARLENWINNYPRKMFGWHTSNEMFDLALRSVGI